MFSLVELTASLMPVNNNILYHTHTTYVKQQLVLHRCEMDIHKLLQHVHDTGTRYYTRPS